MARDFLLEIGTEEMPASACRSVLELQPDRVASLFAGADLDLAPGAVRVLVSPRRIAILVAGVPERQTPREVVQRGPAAEAAFDANGNPSKAALGFARAKGVDVADLQVREENGRSFVFYVSTSEAKATTELLPELAATLVRDMYFPKNMRWGARDLRFSRPVRWLVCLYGDEVVPVEVGGLVAGRTSRGHRWLGGPVDVVEPAVYVETMRSVRVMVDQDERKAHIKGELERLAAELDASYVDPMDKLAENLFLAEWPTILVGRFRPEHLRLPAQVLVTAMQSHQRYLPLVDRDGRLLSTFLYVTNGDPAYAEQITAGNERVLEGRIEDAEFSFDKDLATGLERMAEELDRVVFHVKVGSMKDKTARLVALTRYLGQAVGVPDETLAAALEAARLAKADQVSVMVREFADLEGFMGETYARLAGLPEETAQAIREQFLPDAAGGAPPQTVPGALLATAEKADNIVAAFACAEPPSGSKDPYGLRRAAMGMVTIAFAHGFEYDLRDLLAVAYGQLTEFPGLVERDTVLSDAAAFIEDRLQKALTDAGLSRDAVEASLPASSVFADVQRRAAALDGLRGRPEWDDLVVTFTRPFNLSKKLAENDRGPVEPAALSDEAEKALYEAWRSVKGEAETLAARNQYEQALIEISRLRPLVDEFFDKVLVMTEDPVIQKNRLRLLDDIAQTIRSVAWLERVQA